MRAVYYHRYGTPEVLEFGEIPDARTPGRGEVRVRVDAAALNPKDVLVRKGKFTLFTGRKRFPRIPGYDLAGRVESRGPGVSGLEVGDRVFGMIQSWDAGACAELVTLPASQLAHTPTSLTNTLATAIPLAALTSLQALRDMPSTI